MKIAVTTPFTWPYIRRGNRWTHELSAYLAAKGHQVNFITTKPGIKRTSQEYNIYTTYCGQIHHPLLYNLGIKTRYDSFVLTALAVLQHSGSDIVHSTFAFDGFAAAINRRTNKTPYVFSIVCCDPFYGYRLEKFLFERSIKSANAIISASKYMDSCLKKEYGLNSKLIPAPIDVDRFSIRENKDYDRPHILYSASLNQKRKRAGLLVKAFELFLKETPDAILDLSGHVDDEVKKELLNSVDSKTQAAIHILGVGKMNDLPGLYRDSIMTVLPSLNEPYGLVLLESLASGTPLVGTRSGAIPEIISSPDIGVLFEPEAGPDELCKAMLECFHLSKDKNTSKRCREYALEYNWSVIGPKYEELYSQVIENHPKPHRCTKSSKKYSESALTWDGRKNSAKIGPKITNADLLVNGIFNDCLDALELTADEYHYLDGYRKRCNFILREILSQKISKGKVCFFSLHPKPFGLLLENIGFNVICLKPDEPALHKDDFDMIILDEFCPGFYSNPRHFLQSLKDLLKRQGKLILTATNAFSFKSKSPLKQLLHSAGFRVTKAKYFTGKRAFDPLCPLTVRRFIKNKFGVTVKWFISNLRDSIYIEAQ